MTRGSRRGKSLDEQTTVGLLKQCMRQSRVAGNVRGKLFDELINRLIAGERIPELRAAGSVTTLPPESRPLTGLAKELVRFIWDDDYFEQFDDATYDKVVELIENPIRALICKHEGHSLINYYGRYCSTCERLAADVEESGEKIREPEHKYKQEEA